MRIHADTKHCKRDTMKYEKIKKIVCRSRDSRVRLRYCPYLNNNEIPVISIAVFALSGISQARNSIGRSDILNPFVMKQISEVEEKPFTSSLNYCPDCRKMWCRA
jgi:hypothetical protein